MKVVFVILTSILFTLACTEEEKGGDMLDRDITLDVTGEENKLHYNGYDWEFCSMTGYHEVTGEEKTFFIEYYRTNPGLCYDEILYGQLPENDRPCYGMMKVGTWGEDAVQVHNFYPMSEVTTEAEFLQVSMGEDNYIDQYELRGYVYLSPEDAANHPEYMSGSGEMEWDLTKTSLMSYDPGYAISEIPRDHAVFAMAWFVPGLKVEYEGTITWNGETYNVSPETSYGYHDKNFGNKLTNPWIWLNAGKIVDAETGEYIHNAAMDVGGGRPEILGLPIWKTALIVLNIEGEEYDWNFTELWEHNWVEFDVDTSGDDVTWSIGAANDDYKITIEASNPKSKMLFFNYEEPDGVKRHNELWNGGHAESEIFLYEKKRFLFWSWWEEIGHYYGSYGGCEYGEY